MLRVETETNVGEEYEFLFSGTFEHSKSTAYSLSSRYITNSNSDPLPFKPLVHYRNTRLAPHFLSRITSYL